MGKRTRFQQEDKAQLVLQVTKEEDRSANSATEDLQIAVPSNDMPKVGVTQLCYYYTIGNQSYILQKLHMHINRKELWRFTYMQILRPTTNKVYV